MMTDFGATLRDARERSGLTQEELGRLIGYSRTAVSRLESSPDPRITPRALLRMSQALSTPPSALLAAIDGEDPDPLKRRQFLQAGAGMAGMAFLDISRSAPGLVGAHDVAEIEQGIDHLRLLDQRTGGDLLGYFADRLVADAERLLGGRLSSGIADRAQSVYGEACVFAGWLAQDGGDLRHAARHYSDAMTAAQLANDPMLTAHACANLAFLAAKAGQPAKAVQCAQAGQRAALEGHGGPRLRALLTAREATGHAQLGDVEATIEVGNRTMKAFESGTGTDPEWVEFVSDTELSGILGDAHSRVGNHDLGLRQLTEAAQMSVSGRPRNATSWRMALALGFAAAGDPGQAAALGSDVLPDVLHLSSARIRSSAVELSSTLKQHARVPEVRIFHENVELAGLAG